MSEIEGLGVDRPDLCRKHGFKALAHGCLIHKRKQIRQRTENHGIHGLHNADLVSGQRSIRQAEEFIGRRLLDQVGLKHQTPPGLR